jgi:GT2 family glycosyltransferase
MDPVKVCICIPTYKRPELLLRTLESLKNLQLKNDINIDLKINVVENGSERLAYPVIRGIESQFPYPIEFAVEDRRGISYARNRLVAMSMSSKFIAFIDDDDSAEPQWLEELLRVQRDRDADVVLGPVVPEFETLPPDWMASFFYRSRHPTGSQVSSFDFLTGNLLIKTSIIAEKKEPFDNAFALTGGEDSYLGRRLAAKGIRFYWADKAVVHEYVSTNKISISWLVRRYFRGGISSAMIDIRHYILLHGWIRRFMKGIACIFYGGFVIISSLGYRRKTLIRGICLISWGVGSILGLIGVRWKEYNTIIGK